jgi:hypothetical protein
MARKIFEMIATIGEWTDPQTGRRCKKTVPIGTVFEHESGRMSARLELVPVFPGWSGFVAFRPCATAAREVAPEELESVEAAAEEQP